MNIKAVRRTMKRNSLAFPYAKHRNCTGRTDLAKPDDMYRRWETNIDYVSTVRDGMANLMSIMDCFSKKWIFYKFSGQAQQGTASGLLRGLVSSGFQMVGPLISG